MNNDFTKSIIDKLEQGGHTLLYLTKFGSHLYGTNTLFSDQDYKGIFLPSFTSCVMADTLKQISTTTNNNENRNTKNDVDVQLLSFQYWIKKLRQGEINSIDLMYSSSNQNTIEYNSLLMRRIFLNAHKFYNIKDVVSKGRGYIQAMLKQRNCSKNKDLSRRRKSLSHAIRVCEQIKDLLINGKISFPISNANFVTNVKLGLIEEDVGYEQVKNLLNDIDAIEKSSEYYKKETFDINWISSVMRGFY